MTTKTINPLHALSIQDLKELIEGYETNFVYIVQESHIVKNAKKFLSIYLKFLTYLQQNKVLIKQNDKPLNISYGEMAIMLIRAELRDRGLNNIDNKQILLQ